MFVAAPRRKRGVRTRAQVAVKIAVKKAPEKAPLRLPRSEHRSSVLQNNTTARQPPHRAALSPPNLPGRLPSHDLVSAPPGPHIGCQSPASILKENPTNQAPKQLSHESSRAAIKPPQAATGSADEPAQYGTEHLSYGPAIYDLISSKFDTVITSIDGEIFSGDERELSELTVNMSLLESTMLIPQSSTRPLILVFEEDGEPRIERYQGLQTRPYPRL